MRRAVILVAALIVAALVLWADATMPLLSCAEWTDGCNTCGRSSLLSGIYCIPHVCRPYKPKYVCFRRFFEFSR
jgi:hypothetical protein